MLQIPHLSYNGLHSLRGCGRPCFPEGQICCGSATFDWKNMQFINSSILYICWVLYREADNKQEKDLREERREEKEKVNRREAKESGWMGEERQLQLICRVGDKGRCKAKVSEAFRHRCFWQKHFSSVSYCRWGNVKMKTALYFESAIWKSCRIQTQTSDK